MSDDPITITIPRAEAEALSWAMSDLLCWCAGFAAARPDDSTHDPMGVEGTRKMRVRLNGALDRKKSPK
jgi:hypothetical protein